MTFSCPHCHGEVPQAPGQPVRFCPLCGQSVGPVRQPSPLKARLDAERKPARRHEIIRQALRENPDDFDANEALLYHGRLHEPMARGRGIDFSIVKCHLLSVFESPGAYGEEALAAKYDELLRGPQLQRTMALAPDPQAFFREYVFRLAREYVDLFIRGDSRNSRLAFGFGRSGESLARRCAEPVRGMLAEITLSPRLTDAERLLFLAGVRSGFAAVFAGHEALLDTEA